MAAGTQPGGGCARRRAAHWLGHVILFSGCAGGTDRGRYRLAAQHDCRRRIARPADGGADLAAGRPHDCAAWRPSGPGGQRAAVRGRALRDRAGTGALGLSRGLDRGRGSDGGRPLRCGLCRARPALRHGRARADHRADAVRRICQHGILAARRLPCRDVRLAQCVLRLCRVASSHRASARADVPGRESSNFGERLDGISIDNTRLRREAARARSWCCLRSSSRYPPVSDPSWSCTCC